MVRGLAPSAMASAELDHDSPSARRARIGACRSSMGGASKTTSCAAWGLRRNPRFVALTFANVPSSTRSLPTSTRSRARCDSSACLPRKTSAISLSLDASAGQASPSARTSVNNTGRVASETAVPAQRTTLRQASTTSTLDAKRSSTSLSRRGRSLPREIKRAAGVFSTSDARLTSALSAGMHASRAACSARASAARASFVCRRRIAIPEANSS